MEISRRKLIQQTLTDVLQHISPSGLTLRLKQLLNSAQVTGPTSSEEAARALVGIRRKKTMLGDFNTDPCDSSLRVTKQTVHGTDRDCEDSIKSDK